MRSASFGTKSNIPHFFKIILEKTISKGTLGIPVKFVRKYGKLLSSAIILKVPTGKKWKVELLKNGNQVLLQKGWLEFSNHYSLKAGHLLMFKYEGDCHFSVLIFDETAVEIDYPVSEINSGEQILQEPNIQGNIYKKSKSKNSTGKQAARKYPRSNISRALQAANEFNSSYPSFTVVLKLGKTIPYIPMDFVREHIGFQERRTARLKVADRSWPVNLNVYYKKYVAGFYRGWRKFGNENLLKKGDVCVFELIKSNTFNVRIFRSKN